MYADALISCSYSVLAMWVVEFTVSSDRNRLSRCWFGIMTEARMGPRDRTSRAATASINEFGLERARSIKDWAVGCPSAIAVDNVRSDPPRDKWADFCISLAAFVSPLLWSLTTTGSILHTSPLRSPSPSQMLMEIKGRRRKIDVESQVRLLSNHRHGHCASSCSPPRSFIQLSSVLDTTTKNIQPPGFFGFMNRLLLCSWLQALPTHRSLTAVSRVSNSDTSK